MRYTEVRLDPLGEEMLRDIDEDTLDFQPNYDNSRKEPVVLPARFPNLLVNGSAGIAVGMATNMPPHNLTEAINGCIALLDDPEMTIADLSKIIVAPDFPTGGIIYGYEGVREAYETGRGRVVIRAKAEIESKKEHDLIVITEIPYGVNRAELIKSIAQLVIDKKIDGIANVNDESDREGMRIVVTLKSDANANVVLNKLYKLTAMQSSFAVNNVALVHGRPRTLNLKEIIQAFNDHRREVVLRRTRYELKKAKDRAHILEGLMVAVQNIDEVVQIIKTSKTNDDARARLSARFGLTEPQTQAILEMRLRALTNLAVEDLQREIDEIHKKIAELQLILSDENVLRELIKSDLREVAEKFGDKRRTQINYAAGEFNAEDFYADDDMIITISHMGYIKRTPLAEFRAQNRGGVGARGSVTRDKDFIEHIYTASMHNTMLFFTDRGLVYKMPVYDLPEGTKQTKGRALQNLLNIEPGDSVNAFIRCKGLDDPEYTSTHYLVFATRNGLIKKTVLSEYARVMAKGKKAILIREGDSLVGVELTDGNSQILVANRHGRAVRFNENELRAMGRVSSGVRGMKIDEDSDDAVVGLVVMPENSENSVLVLSQKGFGKRSQLDGYRLTRRGARGVKTMNITDKTGELIAFKSVNDDNDLMIINKSGVVIRVHVSDIRIMGRATQGVRIINLEKRNDTIASVCCVEADPDEETEQIAPDAEELPALTESETEPEEEEADEEISAEEESEENE